ncbi:MAG: 16S rRNA processing protein RimM [bacterium]|nr:MAG: 16S rRNA processing protein RimM [bacterium]
MRKRPEFISIGIITKAYGVKGELMVIPITDEPQQFERLKNISIKYQTGEREFFPIEKVRVKPNRIILKLTGINERNQALTLKGLYVDKHLDECKDLPPDEYYIFDLIGMNVKTTDNLWLGEVTDVLTLPANDVYVINDGSKEYLIPAIKDVIKKVNLEDKYILIEPLDGLL